MARLDLRATVPAAATCLALLTLTALARLAGWALSHDHVHDPVAEGDNVGAALGAELAHTAGRIHELTGPAALVILAVTAVWAALAAWRDGVPPQGRAE
ncbi:hypothetical protein [Streptomyces albireticuli]|uniref:Uncharacterized protein n=1 Tax=Streptomyces albireticuli TaxID=1940 RepID=A0A2A2DCU2_9ACTN|nr:hypothetical protein [Streptomyces albireticuli]MCD9145757.1 hypothetical protein [Streptomyces albireticuli]MCD9165834.1 hypothetical protein [Streptomyces albireticuli]MCD9194487.1 hypothetical protein [Streptomyces albireticuli]PAU50283.1 hypothetical protein CK936_03360 [Streptomyces albireticuli]